MNFKRVAIFLIFTVIGILFIYCKIPNENIIAQEEDFQILDYYVITKLNGGDCSFIDSGTNEIDYYVELSMNEVLEIFGKLGNPLTQEDIEGADLVENGLTIEMGSDLYYIDNAKYVLSKEYSTCCLDDKSFKCNFVKNRVKQNRVFMNESINSLNLSTGKYIVAKYSATDNVCNFYQGDNNFGEYKEVDSMVFAEFFGEFSENFSDEVKQSLSFRDVLKDIDDEYFLESGYFINGKDESRCCMKHPDAINCIENDNSGSLEQEFLVSPTTIPPNGDSFDVAVSEFPELDHDYYRVSVFTPGQPNTFPTCRYVSNYNTTSSTVFSELLDYTYDTKKLSKDQVESILKSGFCKVRTEQNGVYSCAGQILYIEEVEDDEDFVVPRCCELDSDLIGCQYIISRYNSEGEGCFFVDAKGQDTLEQTKLNSSDTQYLKSNYDDIYIQKNTGSIEYLENTTCCQRHKLADNCEFYVEDSNYVTKKQPQAYSDNKLRVGVIIFMQYGRDLRTAEEIVSSVVDDIKKNLIEATKSKQYKLYDYNVDPYLNNIEVVFEYYSELYPPVLYGLDSIFSSNTPVDYKKLVEDNKDIFDAVNTDLVDELWIIDPLENQTASTNNNIVSSPNVVLGSNLMNIEGYNWINYNFPDRKRPLFITSFKEMHPENDILDNFAFRAAKIIDHASDYQKMDTKQAKAFIGDFYTYDLESVTQDDDTGVCGNLYFPPNSTEKFNYTSTDPVGSDCESFGLGDVFPRPVNDPYNGVSTITCENWGCHCYDSKLKVLNNEILNKRCEYWNKSDMPLLKRNYMLWWFQNIPKDWMPYIIHPEKILDISLEEVNPFGQGEGMTFGLSKDNVGLVESVEAKSPGSEEALANPTSKLTGEDAKLSVSESGRYVFFQDGEEIAEADVVVNGESIDIKLYNDVNGNGRKDEEEKYYADYTSIKLSNEAKVEEFKLNSGWNLINIPLYDTREEGIKTAKQLLNQWNKQIESNVPPITHLAKYENGQFRMYSQREKGYEFGEDFNLVPGEGLFVLNLAKVQVKVTFSGEEYRTSVPMTLNNGWNLVGVISEDKEYTAESLIITLEDNELKAEVVSQFESGKYESVIRGEDLFYGNDFNLIEKRGYFIKVKTDQSTSFTP